MNTLRDFAQIINLRTLIITVLALLSTYLSRRYNFVADLPIDLLGLAVVFPLVFSINSAYRMREDALQAFARLKGNAIALFYAHRDWSPEAKGGPKRARALIEELLRAVAASLHSNGSDSIRAGQSRTFEIFSEFSDSIETLRRQKTAATDVSRANEYLRDIIVEYDKMSNIARYRTPISLRAFTRLFLNLFPIIFGPHFANIDYPDYPVIGYVFAGLYAFVLVSLDNVQDHLENPFDGIGTDDLQLNVIDEVLPHLDEA